MPVAAGILHTIAQIISAPGPAALWGYHEDDSTSPNTIIKTEYSDVGVHSNDLGAVQVDTDMRFGGAVIRDGSDWSDGSMAWLNNKGSSGLFELHVVDFENDVEQVINVEVDEKPSGGTYSATHVIWRDPTLFFLECRSDPGVRVTFRLKSVQLQSSQTLGSLNTVTSLNLTSGIWPGSQPASIPDRFRGNVWFAPSTNRFYWRGEEDWNGTPFIFKHSFRVSPTNITRVSSSNDWGNLWPSASDNAAQGQGPFEEGGDIYMNFGGDTGGGGNSESLLHKLASAFEGVPVDGWPDTDGFKLDSNNDESQGVESVQTVDKFDSSNALVYAVRYQAPPNKHNSARVIWANPTATSGDPDTVITILERTGQESATLPTFMTWR